MPPQSALFGMMRMYATLNERSAVDVAVFTTPDEAERWLAELRLAL